MKRLLAVILATFYLSFSAGATMHLHYCMGKLVNFSLADTHDQACGNCGMQKHEDQNDCCKEVRIVVKIADTHLSSKAVHPSDIQVENFILYPPFQNPSSALLVVNNLTYRQNRGHAPPGLTSRRPLYLQHKNFRI